MTYASILEAYGWERFADDARAAGATSLIVVDLPAGERPELRRVQLVAPTSTDERLRLAAEQTDGWLYLVTVTGTTGARDSASPPAARRSSSASARVTDVPLYAGFGISTPEHARETAELVDGIVVGSRAVEVAEDGPDALREYVGSLRAALDLARASKTTVTEAVICCVPASIGRRLGGGLRVGERDRRGSSRSPRSSVTAPTLQAARGREHVRLRARVGDGGLAAPTCRASTGRRRSGSARRPGSRPRSTAVSTIVAGAREVRDRGRRRCSTRV